MGYSQTKIGRLSVIESTWGATTGTFTGVESAIDCEAPALTLTEESLTIDGIRASFEEPTHLSGSKMNSTMSFKCFLNGWSSTSPGNPATAMGVSGSIHPIGLLVSSVLLISIQEPAKSSRPVTATMLRPRHQVKETMFGFPVWQTDSVVRTP